MAVVVPEVLRESVLRALVGDIRRRQLIDGGAPISPEMRAFLHALSSEVAAEEQPTSARGSGDSEPANVMTTNEIAQHIGCSDRWAREVARRAGGAKQGRDWAISLEQLDRYMTREDVPA